MACITLRLPKLQWQKVKVTAAKTRTGEASSSTSWPVAMVLAMLSNVTRYSAMLMVVVGELQLDSCSHVNGLLATAIP